VNSECGEIDDDEANYRNEQSEINDEEDDSEYTKEIVILDEKGEKLMDPLKAKPSTQIWDLKAHIATSLGIEINAQKLTVIQFVLATDPNSCSDLQ
jgi:hypothetical protein